MYVWNTLNDIPKNKSVKRRLAATESKGGSWMDGPLDLRISNFKNIDSTNGYPDVGFRLVKEIAQ